MSMPSAAPGHVSNFGGGNAAHTMQPTWQGFVHSTHDALVVLEACLEGRLHHIPRRPHDRERGSLIASGNIFVYEENASGIKRWTDGMTWSPSRIMGNFLVYRELNPNNYPSGEKKVARKRKRSADLDSEGPGSKSCSPALADEDRRLVGSLVDSYGFKPDGLVKRTLTVQYKNVAHHLISYYTVKDVKDGKLKRPEFDPNLAQIRVRPELLNLPFKQPIHDAEDMDPAVAMAANGAMIQLGTRQMGYAQHFAVQPHIQTYHPTPHHAARGLHPIQTTYPNTSYMSSHPVNLAISTHYPTHMNSVSPLSASPASHTSSPSSYSHSLAYDSACQVRYTSIDQRADPLWSADSTQSFVTDQLLMQMSPSKKRLKVDTPMSNEALTLPPSTNSYDCSPLPFDGPHYSISSAPATATATSHDYGLSHHLTSSISNAGLSITAFDSYDYGKLNLPPNQGLGLALGFDDHHLDVAPSSWSSSSYQDLHHPMATAGLT